MMLALTLTKGSVMGSTFITYYHFWWKLTPTQKCWKVLDRISKNRPLTPCEYSKLAYKLALKHSHTPCRTFRAIMPSDASNGDYFRGKWTSLGADYTFDRAIKTAAVSGNYFSGIRGEMSFEDYAEVRWRAAELLAIGCFNSYSKLTLCKCEMGWASKYVEYGKHKRRRCAIWINVCKKCAIKAKRLVRLEREIVEVKTLIDGLKKSIKNGNSNQNHRST